MKKHLLFILATLLPLVASAQTKVEIDGIWYNLVSKAKQAEVTSSDGTEYSGSITIPATVTYNGVAYSVTSIGSWAFSGCSSLTSITLPESVTSIGSWAFAYCSSLTAITIPESVTSIGNNAFSDCSSLTSITLPESVTSIGGDAFSSCDDLTSIVVAEGNKVYDSRNRCNAIIETSSNTLIQGCSATIIPASVTSIGKAFFHCDGLTSITIPEGVTSIGNDAFCGCSSLTSITIPESVTSIGDYAFYLCSSLTAITIPASVTSIGIEAFAHCSNLTAIVVAEGNKVYDSRGGCNAIIETSSNTLIQGCSATIIPASVTSIGSSAFRGCDGLTSITIPESVTSIGEYAFSECYSLKSITLPEGVTSIGERAFAYCSSLTAITIPEGVTSIGNNAFSNCSSLTAITIPEDSKLTSIGNWAFSDCRSLTAITLPEGVTSIGDFAFAFCSSLTTITCKAVAPPTIEGNTFYEVNKSIPVYVPAGSVEAYKVAEGWSEFTNISMSVPITHITLSQSSATLTEGEDLTLTMTTNPENADRNLISWSSSNPSVATVDNTGKVTAIAPGTATITAMANDGSGVSASCEVTVVARSYALTFLVDGDIFLTDTLTRGTVITLPEEPTKEGHTFSGWGKVPETMPAEDLTISGTFIVNKYLVTFKIGDEVIAADSLEYGASIVAPEAPEKEGYTFNGWGEIAETVPAHDLTYEGSYSINSYTLTYTVDGEVVLTLPIVYGTAIPSLKEPTKEGYTFSGWNEVPEVMPANDVTIEGTFTQLPSVYLTINQADNGCVKQHLVQGTSCTFVIEAAEGWKIHTVTFNGEDVTSQLTEEGTFTTPALQDDAVLNIAYEKIDDAIESTRAGAIKVQGHQGIISISGTTEGTDISLYTTDGTLVTREIAEGDTAQLTVPTGQVYIVKVADTVVKIGM